MLRYFFITGICLFATVCNAQLTTLKNLQHSIGQTATHLSDSLVNKGWKLDPTLTGAFQNDAYRTFSFGNLKTDPKKAMAWIRIHNERASVNRVYYQAPDESAYLLLLEELNKLEPEIGTPDTVEGQTITTYTGKDFIYQTILFNGNFTFVVISKNYYNNYKSTR